VSLGEALGFGPRLCRGYGTGDDSRCPPWARMRSCLPARPHHAACHELRHTCLTRLKAGIPDRLRPARGSVSGAGISFGRAGLCRPGSICDWACSRLAVSTPTGCRLRLIPGLAERFPVEALLAQFVVGQAPWLQTGAPEHRSVPLSCYVVKYHISGLMLNWVTVANDAGGPDRVFFQTSTVPISSASAGVGPNRPGCCVVRYDASLVTAFGFVLNTEASINLSACGLQYPPKLDDPAQLKIPKVVG